MTEIILSFFSAIGITLLTVRILDYFFYRKRNYHLSLIVDLRGKNCDEVLETMELIATVRSHASGKAAVSRLIIIPDEENTEAYNLTKKLLSAFSIPVSIFVSEKVHKE
jgi:hypothetical protein